MGLDDEQTIALFFGQIKTVKGLDILLNAFPSDVSDLTLVIAGKPWKNDFSDYEKIIKERGLSSQVKLIIKYISEEERDTLYNAADFIVLPYRQIFQSGVLLMAMSYGLPVIASDLKANKEVIDDDQGLLFQTENPIDLKEKIMTLYNNPDLSERLSKTALNTIKTSYSWNTIATKYFPIIE